MNMYISIYICMYVKDIDICWLHINTLKYIHINIGLHIPKCSTRGVLTCFDAKIAAKSSDTKPCEVINKVGHMLWGDSLRLDIGLKNMPSLR